MTAAGPVIVSLRALPWSERRRALEQFVVVEVKVGLQMSATDHLPKDQSVLDLGLTSLGAVELKERLEEQLGCAVDADVLFNHPTVENLVDYLVGYPLRDLFAITGTRDDKATPTEEANLLPDGSAAVPKALVDDLLKRFYQV